MDWLSGPPKKLHIPALQAGCTAIRIKLQETKNSRNLLLTLTQWQALQ